MTLNNPLHNLQTAGLIGAIAFVALAPSPWEVSYVDWIQQQVRVEERRPDNAQPQNAAPSGNDAVDAIATKTAEKYGIPKPLIMAIAKHETGNFKAVIGNGNAWGLKCVGSHPSCTKTKTTEYSNGVKGSYRLAFESCTDADRCARILGQTLINLNTSGQWEDIDRALDSVGKRYATDPQWSRKVKQYL